MTAVTIVTEDVLGELAVKRILTLFAKGLHVTVLGKCGCDYIDKRAADFYRAAQPSFPVILLRDLDTNACPPELLDGIVPVRNKPCFLFRIAVREVEAWLLADKGNIAHFLGVRQSRIPQDTETIERPKEFLISLARHSRKRQILDNIPPDTNSTARVGRGYNTVLTEFTVRQWNPYEAALHSRSLERSMDAIQQFVLACS